MMAMSGYLSEEVLELINKYMPDSGEGETQASQACTAVNKLTYKWYNDGDVFDNSYYLEGWCNDLSSYANWLYNHSLGRDILMRITHVTREKEYEELLADLGAEVITKENLESLEKLEKEGSIYSESGPFKFDEYRGEEEEW